MNYRFDAHAKQERQIDGSNRFANSYKFIPPRSRAGIIRRHRILSEVTANKQYSAIVIQGPAGYGKTTLLGQILQEVKDIGYATAWLTLDEEDNDFSHFNTSIITLVTHAINDNGPLLANSNNSNNSVSTIENILDLFVSTNRSVALFLDECHVINEPANLNLLNLIIERSPHNITFYLGSRSVLSFTRGKMLISGNLKWIRPEQLCFTIEEVHTYLNGLGLQVTEKEAESFHQRTGGWSATLQLLQLALKGKKVNRDTLLSWVLGCQNELTDYLADNVMSEQPEEIRQFLFHTSLLSRLSASLCEAVTGINNAQQILHELMVQGLFIRAMDVEQHWFEYHSLFRDYLKTQLVSSKPSQIHEIHRNAANWYRSNGYMGDAVQHFLAANEYDKAAEVLNNWIPNLISTARLLTVIQYCEQLPKREFTSYPMLAWGHAWALLFLRQLDKAHDALTQFNRMAEQSQDKYLHFSAQILNKAEVVVNDIYDTPMTELKDIQIKADKNSILHCFDMGALANVKSIGFLQEAGQLSKAEQEAIVGEFFGSQGGAAFSGAYSSSIVAYAMIMAGKLSQAMKRLNHSLKDEKLKIQGSFASAALSALYGFALYESGKFAEAESYLRDNIDMISQTLPVGWLIPAYLSLARSCAISDSENMDYVEILNRGEQLGLVNNLPRMVQVMRRERIRTALIYGKLGEVEKIKSYTNDTNENNVKRPLNWIPLGEDCDDSIISNIRREILCGNPAQAINLIEREIKNADNFGRIRRKIKLMIMASIAQFKLGVDKVANSKMVDAISLAQSEGYVALFIDEGDYSLNILANMYEKHLLYEDHERHSFVRMILLVAGRDIDDQFSHQLIQPIYDQLTKKERRILDLLVGNISNAEIADQLFVSINTIKFHLKNIYSKLGIQNRIQAAEMARKIRNSENRNS